MVEVFIILPIRTPGDETQVCLKKRHELLIPPAVEQGIRIPDWRMELQVIDVLQDLVGGKIVVRVKPEECNALAEEVERLEGLGWVVTEETV